MSCIALEISSPEHSRPTPPATEMKPRATSSAGQKTRRSHLAGHSACWQRPTAGAMRGRATRSRSGAACDSKIRCGRSPRVVAPLACGLHLPECKEARSMRIDASRSPEEGSDMKENTARDTVSPSGPRRSTGAGRCPQCGGTLDGTSRAPDTHRSQGSSRSCSATFSAFARAIARWSG